MVSCSAVFLLQRPPLDTCKNISKTHRAAYKSAPSIRVVFVPSAWLRLVFPGLDYLRQPTASIGRGKNGGKTPRWTAIAAGSTFSAVSAVTQRLWRSGALAVCGWRELSSPDRAHLAVVFIRGHSAVWPPSAPAPRYGRKYLTGDRSTCKNALQQMIYRHMVNES